MLTYKRRQVTYNLAHVVTRRIPRPGRPLVKVGQLLKPYEIVGVGEESAGFRSLNLAKLLGVKPGEAGRFLLKQEGSFIYKGELLARKEEFFGLRVLEIHSPISGVVAQIDTRSGVVNLEYMPRSVKIPAGVAGQVAKIGRSLVKIKTLVTKVRGVIGSGSLKEGVVKLIGSPELPLKVDQVTEDLAGKIIVGGSQVSKEVLYKCLSLGVRGVVSGGINFVDFQDLVGPRGPLEDVGVGLLVLSGFGNFPLQSHGLEVFQKLDQRPALLYGARSSLLFPEFNRAGKAQGRVSQTEGVDGLADFGILKIGQKVRVLSLNYLGLFGIIKKLRPGLNELPSGLRAETLIVELMDGREIEVGARNVEIVE